MTKQTYPPRIMYIECKGGGFVDPYGYGPESQGGGLHGSARIGRVTFSRTGASLHYSGKTFQSLKGGGFKANYFCAETGEQYWISGPRRDGTDRLYKSDWPVEIDEDVREEYWTEIRMRPELKEHSQTSLSTTKRPNATKLTRNYSETRNEPIQQSRIPHHHRQSPRAEPQSGEFVTRARP